MADNERARLGAEDAVRRDCDNAVIESFDKEHPMADNAKTWPAVYVTMTTDEFVERLAVAANAGGLSVYEEDFPIGMVVDCAIKVREHRDEKFDAIAAEILRREGL